MLSGFPVENGLEVGCGCLDWWPLQYPGDKGTTFSLMKNWGRKWQQWCEQPTLWPSDLTCYFLETISFLKDVQSSPWNGGNPREDLSLAIHNVAGALPGWLCWGQGHRKPALWSLWGLVNTSRQAWETEWGIWP